ncbi:MAG: hypothetical protein EA384_00090, partial [Spirochaetaceae bacterium]
MPDSDGVSRTLLRRAVTVQAEKRPVNRTTDTVRPDRQPDEDLLRQSVQTGAVFGFYDPDTVRSRYWLYLAGGMPNTLSSDNREFFVAEGGRTDSNRTIARDRRFCYRFRTYETTGSALQLWPRVHADLLPPDHRAWLQSTVV